MSKSLRTAGFLLVVVVGMVAFAAPAAAHTGFESSTPTDGATIADPLPQITLAFSGEAEPAGDGFQVLDIDGQIRTPTTATSDDGLTWTLTFDQPLAGGTFGVRWMVKAPDAHPIDGAFSFTVTAPASIPEVNTPTATATSQATLTAGPPVARASEAPVDLQSFLEGDGSSTANAEWTAALARIIGLLGAMIGIGGLVFAVAVLRGARTDIRFVLYWVRRGGLLLLLGAAVELVAQVVVAGGGGLASLWSFGAIADVVFSSLGVAIGLRAIGGFALTAGARLTTVCATEASDPVVAIKELVAVGALSSIAIDGSGGTMNDPPSGRASQPYLHEGDRAWSADVESAGAFGGAAAVIASFIFDGHTVSKGDWAVTSVVNIVHVTGAAIWAGGVVMLASVLWRRYRRNDELRTLQLAVRFSVVASGALAVVGVAGLILTVIVLDTPAELWQTPWGRLLIAKALLVAVAAGGGGYNHLVLIPQLNEASDESPLSAEFRTAVTIEGAVLAVVVVVTAFLVAAAS